MASQLKATDLYKHQKAINNYYIKKDQNCVILIAMGHGLSLVLVPASMAPSVYCTRYLGY